MKPDLATHLEAIRNNLKNQIKSGKITQEQGEELFNKASNEAEKEYYTS